MNIIKNPVLNLKEENDILPLDIALVKNFLKIDFEEDDEIIQRMIKTAITQCETYTNKSLNNKTFVYSTYTLRNKNIILPYSPIISINNIKIINKDCSVKEMESSEYFLDTIGGVLNLKNNIESFYRVDIEYTVGLEKINDELIQAILMHIARMYEDRSGYSSIPLNSMNIYKKYKEIKL